MRKTLATLALFCVSCACFAQTGGSSPAGASSSSGGGNVAPPVQKDQQTGEFHGWAFVGYSPADTYEGFAFTAGSSYTLHSVTLPLQKFGSPAFTLKVFIYTDSGKNTPGAVVGTGSSSIPASTLKTTVGDISFGGMNAALTSGTKYWVVLVATGSRSNFTDYVAWQDYSGIDTDVNAKSQNGSSWSAQDTFVKGSLTTFE